MKVAVITTVNHNVGDDFVREGILHLLRESLGAPIEAGLIHKHSPVTSRHGFERVRKLRVSKVLDAVVPLGIGRDRILEADLVVQSGAPVYWCHHEQSHCADSEWYDPLIRRRYSRIRGRVPFINLAAGTAQRYASDGGEFGRCERDAAYIREIHTAAKVTTVRDRLARHVLNTLGLDAPVIPCSSIFARDGLGIEPQEPEYVALNYMRGGGHYDFGQGIDAGRWEETFRAFYREISAAERCVFVCHSRGEVREARSIDPNAEILFSRDYADYLRFYSKARFGILNRVHAAFALASFGRPSFVMGSDSRARMAEEIGLEHAFVGDTTLERLRQAYASLRDDGGAYAARFAAIKERARQAYHQALEPLR